MSPSFLYFTYQPPLFPRARTFLCVRMWWTPKDMQPSSSGSPLPSSWCQTEMTRRFRSSSSSSSLQTEAKCVFSRTNQSPSNCVFRERDTGGVFVVKLCSQRTEIRWKLTKKIFDRSWACWSRRWSPFCIAFVWRCLERVMPETRVSFVHFVFVG